MKALRRIWIGDNAGQMLTAVGHKQIAQYLSLRKKVVEQILEFDAELGVPSLKSDSFYFRKDSLDVKSRMCVWDRRYRDW